MLAETNSIEGYDVETHIFGEYDDTKSIDMGWLTTETLVQLKLSNNPIKFWKNKLEKKKVNIAFYYIFKSRQLNILGKLLKFYFVWTYYRILKC